LTHGSRGVLDAEEFVLADELSVDDLAGQKEERM